MNHGTTDTPDGTGSGSTWASGTRSPVVDLAVLLGLGLVLRILIAFLLPGSGFEVDRNSFIGWASDLAKNGPFGFYARPGFHDYTPGYLYALWLVGEVGRALGGIGDLIKVPAILADLALAWLVHEMIIDLGGSRRRALIGAAVILFLPITWLDSVVWGQVDSFGVAFLLISVRELWRGRNERAAIFGTLAAVVKPQLGIIVPLIAAVVIRKALFGSPPDEAGREAGVLEREPEVAADVPADQAGWLGRIRAWERQASGWPRIVTTGLAGLVTAILVSAPFGLSVFGLAGQVASAGGGYPYLTVNAYNPWALVTQSSAGLAKTGQWICDAVAGEPCPVGQEFTVGPIWAVWIGVALFLATVAIVCVLVAVRPDRRTILVGLAILTIAFFVVPTRVHERYMFPFVAVGVVLAAVSLRWRLAYVALSLALFANMYVVLTTLYPNKTVKDWLGIGPGIRSEEWVTIIAVTVLLGFLWALVQLRSEARWRLADDVAYAADVYEPEDDEEPEDERPVTDQGTPAGGGPVARPAVSWSVGSAGAGGAAARASSMAGYADPEDWAPVGSGAWFRRQVLRRPRWPDRSRGLEGEPGGRLDRLDVWLLIVFVVAALVLRLWRLGDPPQMHFDEVYHARTATEFLQSWRYGIDHDIYEWTHPHLAKYAIAGGIVLFGEDQVTATSDLGVPVKAATVERRWADATVKGGRAGDRLYVATGQDVRVYDLRTRALVATIAAPGASALAIDATAHTLYIGSESGDLWSLDTSAELDPIRGLADATASGDSSPPDAPIEPVAITKLEGGVEHLYVTSDGTAIGAGISGDRLVTIDPATDEVLGTAEIAGLADIAEGGSGETLVVRPGDVTDASAEAATLAGILGGKAATYETQLTSESSEVTISSRLTVDDETRLKDAMADGTLDGLSLESRPRLAVAGTDGVTFVIPQGATVVDTVSVGGPATGLALVTGIGDDTLYVANGSQMSKILVDPDKAKNGPQFDSSFKMPGAVSTVYWDPATLMVHVQGESPSGDGQTIYVIEPHGNAVYADARLPFTPAATALDIAPDYLSSDRQQILAFDSNGSTAAVAIGQNPFAWRVPGVLAGALTTGLLFLLARILFRRRAVGLIVGFLTLVDGMFFVQARIAMNDVYVALFIVAAYTVLAALWTGLWRSRLAFWLAMPIIGGLLGLALASKWVGLYAIGGVGILLLARSALGRLIIIAGLIVVTWVLGYVAINEGGSTSPGNLTFALVMIGLTLVAVVVTVLHPIAWTDDEVRLIVGAPVVAGIGTFLWAVATGKTDAAVSLGSRSFGYIPLAFAAIALGGIAWAGLRAIGWLGFGPYARPPAPDDAAALVPPPAPASTGWLRPGWGLGLPLVWAAASLVVLPLAIYIASYIPWALLHNHQIDLVINWPVTNLINIHWPADHVGPNVQTLSQLTQQMYDYHNGLRATHPASSPWWAWPLDLKPVWFYQGSFAGDTSAAVYDAGTIAIWWMAIPAMAFAAYQAFKRRSLGLALIAIAFACQWLPWVRIDRATFQYHYYASLPFVVLGLAYFLAEIWHGASARTWLLARAAAALVIVGPMVMWAGKAPLCAFVRVNDVNPNSQACVGNPGQIVVTQQVGALVVVVVAALILIIWQVIRLDRGALAQARSYAPFVGLAGTVVAALAGLFVVNLADPHEVLLSIPSFSAEWVAVAALIPLAGVGWVVLTAVDSRRFLGGLLAAFAAAFVVLYPNIGALPLPSTVFNAYQGILPTYIYAFQFPVNTDKVEPWPKFVGGPPAVQLGPIGLTQPVILLGALIVTSMVVGYAAWIWRIGIAERNAGPGAGPGGGYAESGEA